MVKADSERLLKVSSKTVLLVFAFLLHFLKCHNFTVLTLDYDLIDLLMLLCQIGLASRHVAGLAQHSSKCVPLCGHSGLNLTVAQEAPGRQN